MSIFDVVILILLLLFTGIGALRGMLRELLSLSVWILAIGGGWLFADAVGSWFEMLQDGDLRRLIGFLLVVLVMLGVLSLAAFMLRKFLPRPDPGLTRGPVLPYDRCAAGPPRRPDELRPPHLEPSPQETR